MITIIRKWLSIIYKGVPINNAMRLYETVTPTKRLFVFYGIQIKWVLIGVTIVKKTPK